MPASGSLLGVEVAGRKFSGVALGERVHCECHDPDCGCKAECSALAVYEWGSVAEDEWQYVCLRCAQRMVERGTAPETKGVADDPS